MNLPDDRNKSFWQAVHGILIAGGVLTGIFTVLFVPIYFHTQGYEQNSVVAQAQIAACKTLPTPSDRSFCLTFPAIAAKVADECNVNTNAGQAAAYGQCVATAINALESRYPVAPPTTVPSNG